MPRAREADWQICVNLAGMVREPDRAFPTGLGQNAPEDRLGKVPSALPSRVGARGARAAMNARQNFHLNFYAGDPSTADATPVSTRPIGTLYDQRMAHRFMDEDSLMTDGLAFLEAKVGKDHPYVAELCAELGMIHMEDENFKKASFLLERAWRIFREKLGKFDAQTLLAQEGLSMTLHMLGEHARADALFDAAMAGIEDIYKKHHQKKAAEEAARREETRHANFLSRYERRNSPPSAPVGAGHAGKWGKVAATRTALRNLTNAKGAGTKVDGRGGHAGADDGAEGPRDDRRRAEPENGARDNWRKAKLKTAAVAALAPRTRTSPTSVELARQENRAERTLRRVERTAGVSGENAERRAPYERKPLWAPVVRGEGAREAAVEPDVRRRKKPVWKPGGALNQAGKGGHHDDKGSFAFGHRAPFAYRGD